MATHIIQLKGHSKKVKVKKLSKAEHTVNFESKRRDLKAFIINFARFIEQEY